MAKQKKDEWETKESNYTFVQETIRPKKKSLWKKIGFTSFLAILFGAISCIVFCLSFPWIARILQMDRQMVSFHSPEEVEGQAGTTALPSATKDPIPSVLPTPTSSTVKEESSEIDEYLGMYTGLKTVAKQVNRSIVTVTSVKNGVDVFNNPSENTNSTCGIMIANNGKELLFFVNKERIDSASNLRVSFQEGTTVEASLYNLYEELGIAIVAVEIADVPNAVLQSTRVADFGESRNLVTGDPVIALGNPNGYMYSVEYGVISNEIYSAYFTDGKVDIINTTIPYNENGEGIVVNLEGKVVGFITNHSEFKNDLNQSINTCIGISKLKAIIENLVNQKEVAYLGIVGNDVTQEIAEKIGIEKGVYVMEVQADSPAFAAGLKKGDVITKIGDSETNNMTTVSTLLSNLKAKQKITITFLRKVEGEEVEMTAEATLSVLETEIK